MPLLPVSETRSRLPVIVHAPASSKRTSANCPSGGKGTIPLYLEFVTVDEARIALLARAVVLLRNVHRTLIETPASVPSHSVLEYTFNFSLQQRG